MAFKEIKAEELTWNPFTQIGKGWFLVTAGDEKASNTMTVSWGGLGVWWGKDAATIYIRQNRCTKEFIDAKETFTISSLGGIGGTSFTPIVNAPEVAILGVSRSATRPVWDGSAFVPRLVLPLSLSYDHRVIDGAAAARFNAHLATLLADFRRVML